MPIFFGLYANFYRMVCRNCTLRVHRIVFMGSIFLWKKTLFKLYSAFLMETFQVFGEIFPARSQNCIGFYVFNRIYVNFFRTLRNILLAGLLDLHSTCSHDCVHEKHLLCKKHFSKCVSDFRRIHFRFSILFFQHGSQNCIGS